MSSNPTDEEQQVTDPMPNEPERPEPSWELPPEMVPEWEQLQPAPRLIVPRPVYATALIDDAHRRARELHAEMVANGTAEYAIPVPRQLTARKLSYLRPACESGQHPQHPDYTCEEVDQTTEATGRYIEQAIARMTTLTAMAELPATLRGPTWKADNR